MSTTNISNIPNPSFEEVWSITQENTKQIKEINKILQENNKQIQEKHKQLQENDKQLQEKQKESEIKITDLYILQKQTFEAIIQVQREVTTQIKELSEHVKQNDKLIKEVSEAMKETDKLVKEIGEQIKENGKLIKEVSEAIKGTDKKVKETTEQLGKFGNRFGEMEEHLVAPRITEKFNDFGYHFSEVGRNIKLYDENRQRLTEIDIFLEDDDFILCVEVKVKPDEFDVKKHINQIEIAHDYFKTRRPKEKKVIGAIAGTVFNEKLKNTIIENGMYAITPTGDTFKIGVPEGFQPKFFYNK
jgi:chromosome segregation ATPase